MVLSESFVQGREAMSKINDYSAAERYVGWRILLLVFGGVIILIPVALAFGNGLLSPQALASVLIAYAACVTVAVFVILRNAKARLQVSSGEFTGILDESTRRKFQKRIRRLQLGVVFFALVLVYGLWETRKDPWPPRLFGATMNLLFQTVMIQSIRRMRKLLKHDAADQRQ